VNLREAYPSVALLILSGSLDRTGVQRIRAVGAYEILDKLTSLADIVGAISCLGSG
jgi:DNA-binding NarL/FixJ family response regulator